MGKKRDAIREVYKDCTTINERWRGSEDRFEEGCAIQAHVILNYLKIDLGEDYDYGS